MGLAVFSNLFKRGLRLRHLAQIPQTFRRFAGRLFPAERLGLREVERLFQPARPATPKLDLRRSGLPLFDMRA